MFNRKTRLTVEEWQGVLDVATRHAIAMYEEARKATMVEQGLLPQEHLSYDDLQKHLHRLRTDGHTNLGRSVAEGHFRRDPDLTARDN
jgi:hypothetical protein